MNGPTQDGAHHGSDTGAAYTGLIVGAIALFIAIYTIITVTHHHYERIEAAAPAVPPAQ
jgi:tellurite resistance protein TehA-like permease